MKISYPISKSIAAAMVVALFSFFAACKKDSDNNPNNNNPNNNNPNNTNPDLATVSTDRVESISFTSARVVSTVSKEGKSAVVGMGIAYGKNPNPTVVADNFIPRAAFGVGTFTTELNNLEQGTTYYVRSYATNAVGTAYGEQKTFTTLGNSLPTLTTISLSGIGSNTAISGGVVSDQGSSAIVERGIVWSQNPEPNLNSEGRVTDLNPGLGGFSANLSGLIPNTQYFIRAYASNSQGTSYGNELSFTTLNLLEDIEGNIYQVVKIGNQIWMRENLKTSKYRNGENISSSTSVYNWEFVKAGAFLYYDQNPINNDNYGKLYNFYAVADPRGLCPVGWHVPTNPDWKNLESFLGMPPSELDNDSLIGRGESQNIGGKLKAVSSLWTTSTNEGATNQSGFSALPGGFVYPSYSQLFPQASKFYFESLGSEAQFWTSSQIDTSLAYNRSLFGYEKSSNLDWTSMKRGLSVRCIKD